MFDEYEPTEEFNFTNMIFLPFHPGFKLIVLIVAITKAAMGPILSIYPLELCSEVMTTNEYFSFAHYFYTYCCPLIYIVDTFLHIAHRQVKEEAVKREYLPKPLPLLILDVIALIPFVHLASNGDCADITLYPNILCFTEFVVVYRVVQYFSIAITHSIWSIALGLLILFALLVNCVTCFLLLVTHHGLCKNCRNGIYDWRTYIMNRINQTEENLATYIHAASFSFSLLINTMNDESKPSTILAMEISLVLMIFGFILYVVLMPKIFAEAVYRLRRILIFHERAVRIIEETKRRNPNPVAHDIVERFYTLSWTKREGLTSIPSVIHNFPRYVTLDVMLDLVWPVFYHSPTLRNTSAAYKRWLCKHIYLDHKLPNETLLSKMHSYTNLYYLKSGIMQVISLDDGESPLLSVQNGTLLGDISFYVPPYKRNVMVRCLTDCEIYVLPRKNIVQSLHVFPEDRRNIMKLAHYRLKHAKDLYTCKKNLRGLDRSEDEGIAWVKRRWWEISLSVKHWKKASWKEKYQIPPEESNYHCSKFIGQLVLCTDVQLHKKSIFEIIKFPWIVRKNSTVRKVWYFIMVGWVYLVMIIYPPFLTQPEMPEAFQYFEYCTNLIYLLDILANLVIVPETEMEITQMKFVDVILARLKSLRFILDIFSMFWVEYCVVIIGKPEWQQISKFNRLLKLHLIFYSEYKQDWKYDRDPFFEEVYKITVTQFCFVYVIGYFFHKVCELNPDLTPQYFYGNYFHAGEYIAECKNIAHILAVAIGWVYNMIMQQHNPESVADVVAAVAINLVLYILFLILKGKFLATLFLKYRESFTYRSLVSTLNRYYVKNKIHPNLLKRLDTYMTCNWKYYHGQDIIDPTILKDQPRDITEKHQSEAAEKIIATSRAFRGANDVLIRDLARNAKFMIIPKQCTMLLFGVRCKNVTWIINGQIMCQYRTNSGELIQALHPPGEILSANTIFINKRALKSYVAATDCEALYINVNDFYNILQRYPQERKFMNSTISKFKPSFNKAYNFYLETHKDYIKKYREEIFYASKSKLPVKKRWDWIPDKLHFIFCDYRMNPESMFIRKWMIFRVLFIPLAILSQASEGGLGASWRYILNYIGMLCDIIAIIDIVVKLFLPYYDDRGVIIIDVRMCMWNYLSHGFVADCCATLPWDDVLNWMMLEQQCQVSIFLKTVAEFAQLYLFTGIFNYYADVPTSNIVFLMIAKWHTVLFLLMVLVSTYFITHCVRIDWYDDRPDVAQITLLDYCWVPDYYPLSPNVTFDQFHFIIAESLNLALCGVMMTNLGQFHIEDLGISVCFMSLGIVSWFVMVYSQTLLVMNIRSGTGFRQGVNQLRNFLNAERVEKSLIKKADAHYNYWWQRTRDLNVHAVLRDRVGIVFSQDLCYFFYKQSFATLDSVLKGGVDLQRHLSNAVSKVMYFLPGEDIMRHMDLTPFVYIVHRGIVTTFRDGKKLGQLKKGAIFGQLEGIKARPVKCSARADGHADILQISVKDFQTLITHQIRQNMRSATDFENDFIAVRGTSILEDPYDSIRYILRGRKRLLLSRTYKPITLDHIWYMRWLYVVLFGGPLFSSAIVLYLVTLPEHNHTLEWILMFTDILHFAHVISDLYAVNLQVSGNKCEYEYRGFNVLKEWDFHVDVVSLVVPIIAFVIGDYEYHLCRLLRLHLLCKFYRHFCENKEATFRPLLLKFAVSLLLIHALTCGWILCACRPAKDSSFPIPMPVFPSHINESIDYTEWAHPTERDGGCVRITRSFDYNDKKYSLGFLVPRHYTTDYLIAMMVMLTMLTHTNMDMVVPLTSMQVYYKMFANTILHFIELWVASVVLSTLYTKYFQLYKFDYQVSDLNMFLKRSGSSSNLLKAVMRYSRLLFQRQRGCWLPEITQQAHVCLRQDLLGAVYMFHLETPPLFKEHLPKYFLRQLAVRLGRIVAFPGKEIVREGDIFPCLYFIHEGEVEKWRTDSSGNSKMFGLVTMKEYFEMVPALYPNEPFKFTYISRTVVDLVYLHFERWKDLLDGYPEVKEQLYEAAKKMKEEN